MLWQVILFHAGTTCSAKKNIIFTFNKRIHYVVAEGRLLTITRQCNVNEQLITAMSTPVVKIVHINTNTAK